VKKKLVFPKGKQAAKRSFELESVLKGFAIVYEIASNPRKRLLSAGGQQCSAESST
jgi:hypothetical protein